MNSGSALDRITPLTRESLRHELATKLLSAVFQGDLPEGTRLIVQQLAAKFGVSSTPVREALLELEGFGIVQFLHNKGAVIKPFGPQELREIYHLRRILESEAAREAFGKIERSVLEQLREDIRAIQSDEDSDWSQREMATDRHLHELIAHHCGSTRLADEIRRYNLLVQAGRDLVGNQHQAQVQAVADHLAVLDALLDGDAEQAAAAMAQHIDRTASIVEALIFAKSASADGADGHAGSPQSDLKAAATR